MAINPKIKEKAEKIRKEVYGKDVREALASGLEVMSEDVEDVKDRQVNVESQFQAVLDETTGKDVISAPELTAARVGADGTQYPNLKQRLDSEHDKITAQLAHVTLQASKNARDIQDLQNEKVDKVYFIDKLNQLGNMSPNGAFATLQELIVTYPNGAKGVYLVQETGHWYYWNGTEWTDGGIYQALPWDEFMTEDNEPWEVE